MDTPADKILKHQHHVEARANSLGDAMVRELEAVRERLIGKLATVQEKLGGTFHEAPLRKRKAALERQRADVEKVLGEVYGKIGKHVEAAVPEIMDATRVLTIQTMNQELGLAVKLGHGLSKETVKGWFESSTVDGLLFSDWLTKLKSKAADRIVSVGRQAMIEGLGTDAMARMMRKRGIEASIPGARGLAITHAMSASNYAREQTTERHFGDVISGWRRAGVLDDRTCLRCGPYDGRFYPKGDPRPSLPTHWRCRCLYIAIPKGFEDWEPNDRAAAKHSSRMVNHRDGSRSRAFKTESVDFVPGKTTYQQWLKGQLKTDPAFVRRVLGKTRFELFRDGKLTLNRMVTHGRVKTLRELGA